MPCPICLEPFHPGDNVKTHEIGETGQIANHFVHQHCLEQWYQTGHHSCPIDRQQIDLDDWLPVVVPAGFREQGDEERNGEGGGASDGEHDH